MSGDTLSETFGTGRRRLLALPILLVSLASISFETMLTRYFAIASYAEFGYWVISMAMVGYGLSGVVMALFSGAFLRWRRALLSGLPVVLIFLAVLGFHLATINPFNPLALMNPVTMQGQLVYIGLYYVCLFPFFFCAGLFIGLNFMAYREKVTTLYGADMIGAGLGALFILLLMFVLHPFYLVVAILPMLFLAALTGMGELSRRGRIALVLIAALALVGSEWWIVTHNRARFFEYKPIYTALNVPDNEVLVKGISPKGYDMVLNNFTERRDVPVSNNLGLLGVEGPPTGSGLYRDGNRVACLYMPDRSADWGYVKGMLCSLPYMMRENPRVLMIGSGGGFRIPEVDTFKYKRMAVLETDYLVHVLLRGILTEGNVPDNGPVPEVYYEGPQSFLARDTGPFDIIDISVEHLDGGRANIYAYTCETIQCYLRALAPGGMISLPVSIRQFPGYTVKVVNSAAEALRREGIAEPARHLAVFRSEMVARVLISKEPFNEDDIKKVCDFCSERSFDTSYYPGIEPAKVEVWNELPAFTLDDFQPDQSGDALMLDIIEALGLPGKNSATPDIFDLGPVTDERPFLNSIVQAPNLDKVLKKLELLPQSEIGLLINYCVLAQAVVFGALVFLLPFLRIRRVQAGFRPMLRGAVYFAALGLGFLFVEVTLIERFTMVLNDATAAFAAVLSAMLICSGVGSYFAGRFQRHPRRGVLVTLVLVGLTAAGYWTLLGPATLWIGRLPLALQCLAIAGCIAPVSFALGIPFSLGLRALDGGMAEFTPMAWGINGAFSVIASPLTSILALRFGYDMVILLAFAIYAIVWMTFPGSKPSNA